MKNLLAITALSLGMSVSAYAAGPAIQFLGTENTSAGSSQTFSGVTATAWTFDQTLLTSTASDLWFRNVTNDHGLGVCSEGSSACATQGGNVNELSNQQYTEYIRLDRGSHMGWGDIWVSSLDSQEQGTIFWGNDAQGYNVLGSYVFTATTPVERSIFAGVSSAAGWDNTAQYLFFFAGTSAYAPVGTDNDYLVYGVTMVPEPEIYAMMAAGLGLMGFVARRRKKFEDAVV